MWLRYPVAVIGACLIFLLLMRLWVDLPNGFDFDDGEGCLLALLVGVVAGLFLLLFAAFAGAPVLLAEVFIDARLTGVLYRRLKIAAQEHWLGTAIRRTWGFVLGTAPSALHRRMGPFRPRPRLTNHRRRHRVFLSAQILKGWPFMLGWSA
jgi:hypothetical protein